MMPQYSLDTANKFAFLDSDAESEEPPKTVAKDTAPAVQPHVPGRARVDRDENSAVRGRGGRGRGGRGRGGDRGGDRDSNSRPRRDFVSRGEEGQVQQDNDWSQANGSSSFQNRGEGRYGGERRGRGGYRGSRDRPNYPRGERPAHPERNETDTGDAAEVEKPSPSAEGDAPGTTAEVEEVAVERQPKEEEEEQHIAYEEYLREQEKKRAALPTLTGEKRAVKDAKSLQKEGFSLHVKEREIVDEDETEAKRADEERARHQPKTLNLFRFEPRQGGRGARGGRGGSRGGRGADDVDRERTEPRRKPNPTPMNFNLGDTSAFPSLR